MGHVDVPNDGLGDAFFGTIGTSEVAWAEDDGVCVSKMGEREFGEALGPVGGRHDALVRTEIDGVMGPALGRGKTMLGSHQRTVREMVNAGRRQGGQGWTYREIYDPLFMRRVVRFGRLARTHNISMIPTPVSPMPDVKRKGFQTP